MNQAVAELFTKIELAAQLGADIPCFRSKKFRGTDTFWLRVAVDSPFWTDVATEEDLERFDFVCYDAEEAAKVDWRYTEETE